ncbi:MAG: phage head spike fiber domain-containing protein [Brevundimonas sp.]
MSTLDLPSWFDAAEFEAQLVPEIRSFPGPYGGPTESVDLIGDRWRFRVMLPENNHARAARTEALFNRLHGGADWLRMHHLARPVPRGNARGSLVLASAVAQGANSLSLSGVRAGANLLTHSQAINDASWVKQDCTANPNGTSDPAGGATSELITENTAVAAGRYVAKTVSWVAGTTYCVSGFIREFFPGAKRYAGILIPSAAAGVNTGVQWDLATLTATATAGTLIGYGIQDTGVNSWRRVWCAFTAASTISVGLQFRFDDAASNIGGSWTGDGSSGMLLWGAQAEVGSAPTDYAGLGTLLEGDMLGHAGDQLFQVATDATANDAGAITVTLVNRSRKAILSAQAITWDRPQVPFQMLDSRGVATAYRRSLARGQQVEFLEAWAS